MPIMDIGWKNHCRASLLRSQLINFHVIQKLRETSDVWKGKKKTIWNCITHQDGLVDIRLEGFVANELNSDEVLWRAKRCQMSGINLKTSLLFICSTRSMITDNTQEHLLCEASLKIKRKRKQCTHSWEAESPPTFSNTTCLPISHYAPGPSYWM